MLGVWLLEYVSVRIFDGVVRTLMNVRYIPNLKKKMISLCTLDFLGYSYSIKIDL